MVANCLVCLLKHNIKNLYIFYPMKYFCPHSKSNFCNYAYFDYSKNSLIFPVICTIILSCFTLFTLYNVTQSETYSNLEQMLLEFFQILFDLNGIYAYAFMIYKISDHVKDLNGWCQIIGKREYFGLINKDIITKSMEHNAIRNNYIFRFVLVFLLSFYIYVNINFIIHGNLAYNLTRRFCQFFTVYVEFNLLSNLSVTRTTIRRIRTMAFINIQRQFNNRIKQKMQKIQFVDVTLKENPFEETVSRFRRLLSSYSANYKMLNEMFGKSLPVFFLLSLAELVVTLFIVIVYFEDHDEHLNSVFVEWRAWLNLLFITIFTLKTSGDFLVSGLFYKLDTFSN